MPINTLFWTAFLSFLPISELRGALPYALSQGMDWRWAYVYTVSLNALVAPACWIFLSTFHRLFLRLSWYRRFFDYFLERARGKIHTEVERWGWIGIAVFVAIPLPVTGAWTGTLGAWVLGIDKRKTMLAVMLGVMGAGAIVTAVMLLGIGAFEIFVKRV